MNDTFDVQARQGKLDEGGYVVHDVCLLPPGSVIVVR